VDGHSGQLFNQAVGVAIAWGLAIVGSLAILWLCDRLVGLRLTREDEVEGLDVSMHGEEGYIFEQ